jgi:G3E family GTPase
MHDAPLVSVNVVTGFLGSGKTTLIARLLRDPAMAGTAVIVNEFGEVGLDHDLIASSDETLVALTTGCLCCAVRTDLVDTLLELRRRAEAGEVAFARVLIETSGLADPAPILHALMTQPALGAFYALGEVVTLVDCLLGHDTLAAHPEARRQVAMADRLVLTKSDLAPPSPALRAVLASLNPDAAVTSALAVPCIGRSRVLADIPAMAEHGAAIAATTVLRDTPIPGAALSLFIQALAEHCGARLLRMKGLVEIVELPGRPAVLHGVQHVFSAPVWLDAWPSADRRSRMVFIGQGIPRHFPARLLDAIVAEAADEAADRATTWAARISPSAAPRP